MRAHLAWLARWAPAYGYGGVGSAAARCDGDLTRACLFRDRPSREDADRLDAALARMSADLAAPGDGVGILVVAPRAPEWIAGCRHVPDAGALAAALSERAWVAVLADVRAGVGPVASAIAAARDLAGSRFPVVVACGSTPSAVERMRLEVLGNRAFLPVPPPGEDVARAVWEAVRQDVATRGVAFVLDGTGVGAAAEAGRAVAAAGYLTRSFGSQDALLARWLEEVPDVVLVSAAGGDPRGLAAAADLRADPHTGPVSVLVLTDRHDRESRDAIAETGADGWIALPVVPEELDRRIRDALDRRRWLCGRP
ncbi:MAG: response regulator transcription factor, partial [Deltaproteobacteria bacterium]|nr:response regulator transcription factor [Deltaproteobacteria bacterium]